MSASTTSAYREQWAEELLDRLTPFMTALSVVFVLVVLGEQFAVEGSPASAGLTVTSWVLWAVFAGEFGVRLVVAPDTKAFWRRNWWQVLFLMLPFLRFLRLVRAVRLLRGGRVLSSAVRSARSARNVLGGRVAWLSVTSAIVILTSSQLLYAFAAPDSYGEALHAAAFATISGEPIGLGHPFARVLELILAAYSAVVFAALAGTLGAYFLEGRVMAGTGPTDPRTTRR